MGDNGEMSLVRSAKKEKQMFLLFSLYPAWFARTPTACESASHPFELPTPADLTACQRQYTNRMLSTHTTLPVHPV